MADMELDGDSPELVAYRLSQDVRELEWRYPESGTPYNRKEYLDLFAECLEAVKGNRKVKL
jgi:hypothetical protein